MDCTQLRYPAIEQLLLIDISSDKNLPSVLYLRYTSLVLRTEATRRHKVQSNCYFRAEKTELRKRRKKDRNMQVPLSSSWLDDRGKI